LLSSKRNSKTLSFSSQSRFINDEKGDFNLVNFEGALTIFAEVAKHDIEVVVYTSAESILTGNARRNRLVEMQLWNIP